jgi:hypothetical protein
VAPHDGVIRRWQVRGARGELALQVLSRQGNTLVSTTRSDFELIPDEGLHVFPANLPVRAGQLVGVEVTPGAAIGVRRDVRGAATARWFGPLNLGARTADRGEGTGFDHELLLRVEYVPGANWRPSGLLTGRDAQLASPGQKVATHQVELPGRRVRTVVLVRLGDRVAFDLFDGERRVARLAVADADPRGRLVTLTDYNRPVLRLRWSNPDGRTIGNDYTVRARSMAPRT